MNYKILIFFSFLCYVAIGVTGQTRITEWQGDKKGAVSLTFDDGNRNHFKYALPIMQRLHLPATFYVITGAIKGSNYQGRFIGRPVNDIIKESAVTLTNTGNYFERASASKYLGYIGANALYDKSAILFEDGKLETAYAVMDTLYQKVRNGDLKKGIELSDEVAQEMGLSWDSIKLYAAKGYEFASHTVTHTHLAVLDSTNISYELYKSKEDLKNHLGEKYTFDAEIPFGIEHPRAIKYGLPAYSALRNLMTDTFLFEINRGYKTLPGSSNKEYVQWQRGPLSKTSLQEMKSYVDTTLTHNNIWLVLVFHGIDGLGWEALPHQMLDSYFSYIRQNQNKLWVATFADVAKYMRERMHSQVFENKTRNTIKVRFKESLDKKIYDVPLTLKTYLPETWKSIKSSKEQKLQIQKDSKGNYVLYDLMPGQVIILSPTLQRQFLKRLLKLYEKLIH